MASSGKTSNKISKTWWKESVVYQIYPRSFKDSTGDGIGDLNGITEKLDYLKNLGITAIWLCPMFDSPNADNGYDIRDYRKIMADFGTMADFDRLVTEMKKRDLRLIMDLVANHTSDEHYWFQEAKKSRDNPYRDYYIWKPKKDGALPNDWISWFSGSAWEWDEETQEYYLHFFAKKQPDLNWENPKVRQEIYDIMNFWIDKGADGFRLDAIPFISKDQEFPNFPKDFDGAFDKVYASGPRLHEFFREMNQEVFSKRDVFSVGETSGIDLEDVPLFIGEDRNELDTVFHFGTVSIDRQENWWKWRPYQLPELKKLFTRYDHIYGSHSWNTLFMSNHDVPRIVSRYGDDSPEHRKNCAKLFATMLLTLKGTPFIYQGDELGMTNYPFTDINQFNDIAAINAWQEQVVEGKNDATQFMDNLLKTSRDHGRTPMQWNTDKHGGFTKAANSWLAVNPNYKEINAEDSVQDKESIYHHYRNLLAIRKHNQALIYGDYKDLDPEHLQVFIYTRKLGTDQFLIVLNCSSEAIAYSLDSYTIDHILLRNLSDKVGYEGTLEAWESMVIKIQ